MSFVSATKQSILNLVAQDGGPTGVVAGNYTNTSLTVDENGRIMDASSGAGGAGPANPTQDIGATAKNGTDLTFMRSDAAPALEPFGLGAATYNYATVQVDATGRVQSASNGSAPPAPANPTQDIGAMAVNGTDRYIYEERCSASPRTVWVRGSDLQLRDCHGGCDGTRTKCLQRFSYCLVRCGWRYGNQSNYKRRLNSEHNRQSRIGNCDGNKSCCYRQPGQLLRYIRRLEPSMLGKRWHWRGFYRSRRRDRRSTFNRR